MSETGQSTASLSDTTIMRLERELAQRLKECQDMETKLHNECQSHERTNHDLATATAKIAELEGQVRAMQNPLNCAHGRLTPDRLQIDASCDLSSKKWISEYGEDCRLCDNWQPKEAKC